MKIGVVGSGVVGRTLADGFLRHGHEVRRGSREPAKLDDWKPRARDRERTRQKARAKATKEKIGIHV